VEAGAYGSGGFSGECDGCFANGATVSRIAVAGRI